MNDSNYILELRGISKEFPGVQALSNVDLKLKRGEVLALLGENGAGKSTLMKCLFGIYKMDQGSIYLNGEKVKITSADDARKHGISIIQQEMSPILDQSIMENIWLNREPMKRNGIFIDHKKMYNDTKTLLERFNLQESPKRSLRGLSVAKLQLIEIITAVTWNSQIIIMDEPTSALTKTETEQLFRTIQELKEAGCSIIYISHKMEEISRIADSVMVLRDGQLVATHAMCDTTIDDLIHEMVGRDMSDLFQLPEHHISDEEILRVENLSSPGKFQNVSFSLHKGEILGVAGLVGAGRTELLETIFGLRPISGGEIFLNGKKSEVDEPIKAIENRLALLTEDRRADGIFPDWSILDNILIANYHKFQNKLGLIQQKAANAAAVEASKQLRIKMSSLQGLIKDLSGGNQQKVLFERWLLSEPEILLLDEPTRGIDIGAKAEIYSIIGSLAAQGKSIIIVSSELPEILNLSDRILVMHEGRMTGIIDKKDASEDTVMTLAIS